MNRIKVNILGSSYYISTNDSEAHIRAIEQRLCAALSDILEAKPSLSTLDAFALLAMNLVDEAVKNDEAMDRMREQLSQYLEEAARGRIELDQAKAETRHALTAQEELKEEVRRLTRERNQMAKEAAMLREERFAQASQLELDEEPHGPYGEEL